MVKTTKYIDLEQFSIRPITNVVQLPGGEFHPKITEYGDALATEFCIRTRLRDGNDVMKLLTVTNAIRKYRQGIEISAFIPYIPGGRQDRVSNQGEAFTLQVYADLINAQNYKNVFTVDPHSDVTTALINNCQVQSLNTIIRAVLNGYDTIIIPDAGASKKIYSYYLKNMLYDHIKIVQAVKTRDTVTGKLSGFKVLCEPGELNDRSAIILDDICDGGGTFLGLAAELDTQHPTLGKLGLYVTHGIFSKGFDDLFNTFDEVCTTTSWASKDEYIDRLTVIPANAEFPLHNDPVYVENYQKLHIIDL